MQIIIVCVSHFFSLNKPETWRSAMKLRKSILSVILVAALLLGAAPTVFAETVIDSDGDPSTYVFHHNVKDDDYDGPNLQYFSPYVTDYACDGEPTYIQSNIYSMYNTLNGEVIPVYCCDIQVGALPDHRYRRLNLEDSTYSANASNQLRAIMQNGFYLLPVSGETTEEHGVRVSEKLQELGNACGVPDLTIGEAISGTQTALWQAAHGSRLVFTDFVRTIYTTKMPSASKYYTLCNEERENGHIDYTVSAYGKVSLDAECDEWLCSRIQAVYDYLLSLEPVEATQQAVSPASFVQLNNPVLSQNPDGSFDVSVTTTVDVDMAPGDDLTLTAALSSDYTADASLTNGEQTVTLTLNNIPADQASEDVVLTINGNQTVSEVFLYDAYGGRDTAQSMIGIDNSQAPVYASVLATKDRILNFHKTAPVATGSDSFSYHPLEGIIFDIYFAAELNDYLTGKVTLPEASELDHSGMADITVITDEDGRASVNFTQRGMPDGVYLVVEREHPVIKAPVDPFYVFMPTTNADGTGHEYEITVQPKNDVKGSVHIEKDVTTIGNDQSTVDAYENHTWIIGTNIPEDIRNGKSFVITDTLDPRLDYIGNCAVTVETVNGQSVVTTLMPETDYSLNVTDVDSLSDGTPSDAFELTLTRNGMSKIADSIGTDSFENYMLRVRFDAQINGNAEVGTEIPNEAQLRYTNSVNFDFRTESDRPVVETGGAKLLKVDANNHSRVLSGAMFEVYRKATSDEVAAGGDQITHIAGVSAPVVKVSFFSNPELTDEKVTGVTSDENGLVSIYGLAYGEYYLLETKAPNGYNLLDNAVQLTIDRSTHLDEQTVTIENVSGSVLPSTGGIGTAVFTVTGLLLIGTALVFLSLKKRNSYIAE